MSRLKISLRTLYCRSTNEPRDHDEICLLMNGVNGDGSRFPRG